MPAYDRYWRLGVAAMVLIGCLAAGVFAWNLLTTGSLEQLLGTGVSLTSACQFVGFVLIVWTAISHLAAARKRDRARHVARQGDSDAVPLSRIVPGDMTTTTQELLTARGTISADHEGLRFRDTHWRTTSVPWNEARLLEVWLSSTGGQQRRGFSLYGEHAIIEWSLPRGWRARTQRQSDIEAALLATIHTRTGLVPRTFAPALRAPGARPVERTGPNPIGTIFGVVIALAPFAVAAAALQLPLTTEPALTAYVALTFAVLGVLFVIAAMRALGELFSRTPLHDAGMILSPGVLPPDMSGVGTYTLQWRERRMTRSAAVVLGALFAGNVVPLIRIIAGAETAAAGDWTFTLNLAIGGVALLGIALLVDAAFSGRHTITADASGLTSGRRTMRWTDVEEVVAHVRGRAAERFRVVGAEGKVTIEWPAKVRTTPQSAIQAISPNELATLVVARSGKALRAEERGIGRSVALACWAARTSDYTLSLC